MRFRRWEMSNGWQFNWGKLQVNWQGQESEYPKLPWGIRIWWGTKLKLRLYTRGGY